MDQKTNHHKNFLNLELINKILHIESCGELLKQYSEENK